MKETKGLTELEVSMLYVKDGDQKQLLNDDASKSLDMSKER